jgi:uncharacterized membrane protein YgcG
MSHRLHLRFCVLVAGIGLALSPLAQGAGQHDSRGRKYKAPPPAANIQITVLKDFNGKPIANAHVIFHPTEGDRDKGSLETKTDENGKATVDVIPIGDTVTLQVIVNGYQTYGKSYKIDKSEMSMEIRLKRPSGQYSVYSHSGENAAAGKGGGSGSSSGSGSGGSSNSSSGNKSSGSDSQSQPQPK